MNDGLVSKGSVGVAPGGVGQNGATAGGAHTAALRDVRRFIIGGLLVLVVYSPLLWLLARQALKTDLQQHILLIPFISGYLVWRKRQDGQPSKTAGNSPVYAALAASLAVGVAVVGYHFRA